MALDKYIVKEGQSIFDVVIQKYGTLNELFTIFVDNPSLTVNTDLTGLQEVVINSDIVGDEGIKNNYLVTDHTTNNKDADFVAIINQKQFEDGDAFDFENNDTYQF